MGQGGENRQGSHRTTPLPISGAGQTRCSGPRLSREVNDGRGPADFKVSRGSSDKTIVEFKLAKNTQLKRNLEHQVEIYKKASDATRGIKVIVFFSVAESRRVTAILKELKLTGNRDIVLVDARTDNKPTGSKA
jgi:hypothetical protein